MCRIEEKMRGLYFIKKGWKRTTRNRPRSSTGIHLKSKRRCAQYSMGRAWHGTRTCAPPLPWATCPSRCFRYYISPSFSTTEMVTQGNSNLGASILSLLWCFWIHGLPIKTAKSWFPSPSQQLTITGQWDGKQDRFITWSCDSCTSLCGSACASRFSEAIRSSHRP